MPSIAVDKLPDWKECSFKDRVIHGETAVSVREGRTVFTRDLTKLGEHLFADGIRAVVTAPIRLQGVEALKLFIQGHSTAELARKGCGYDSLENLMIEIDRDLERSKFPDVVISSLSKALKTIAEQLVPSPESDWRFVLDFQDRILHDPPHRHWPGTKHSVVTLYGETNEPEVSTILYPEECSSAECAANSKNRKEVTMPFRAIETGLYEVVAFDGDVLHEGAIKWCNSAIMRLRSGPPDIHDFDGP